VILNVVIGEKAIVFCMDNTILQWVIWLPQESLIKWQEKTIDRYPWIKRENQKMIAGTDFDAIFSAMFLSEIYNYELIGFYDFKTIWTNSNEDLNDVRNAIWVDLDIYHKDIKSIGHHILKFRSDDKIIGHKQTLNPNLIRGIYHNNFNRKYPYATIHFLLSLFNYSLRDNDLNNLLIWHPNSSLINAQRYRSNAKEWLINFLKIDSMIKTFDEVITKEFEEKLRDKIYTRIEKTGFTKGKGQTSSMNLKLRGYQCTFKNPMESLININNLISQISDITGWKKMHVPSKYTKIVGEIKKTDYPRIRKTYGCFDNFLEKEDVFSYTIPYRNQIKYTIGINL